jgi:hypothetical protein
MKIASKDLLDKMWDMPYEGNSGLDILTDAFSRV